MRGTETSAADFGRIASIIASLAVPFLIASGGSIVLFGAFAIAAVAAWTLPEQRGKALSLIREDVMSGSEGFERDVVTTVAQFPDGIERYCG